MSNLILGDCLGVMREMPDNSIDSVVTDPPYGLGFMGKDWDRGVPPVEIWQEVLRVLKPGGHLLSFGGTRTYHRMAWNIEEAGFEIRDQIMWLYGQGFPKSQNVSKAIDKAAGAERKIIGETQGRSSPIHGGGQSVGQNDKITTPATPEAKQWDGWGTALKPANEPIVLARKPISEKTIAKNVQKWGTGAINIDGCRVDYRSENDKLSATPQGKCTSQGLVGDNGKERNNFDRPEQKGRFPANVILDEEAGEALDEQSGGSASRFFYCAKASKSERNAGLEGLPIKTKPSHMRKSNGTGDRSVQTGFPDTQSQNNHPTCKPLKLMSYLCRLITPPGGTVLDPFMGSGTTGIAAENEGLDFIGIEKESEYFEIAQKRIGGER